MKTQTNKHIYTHINTHTAQNTYKIKIIQNNTSKSFDITVDPSKPPKINLLNTRSSQNNTDVSNKHSKKLKTSESSSYHFKKTAKTNITRVKPLILTGKPLIHYKYRHLSPLYIVYVIDI